MGLKQAIGRALYQAAKAIGFEGFGGQGWTDHRLTGWSRNNAGYVNSGVNFQLEVGPLTGASLVMAAVNYTGTRLQEAPLRVMREGEQGSIAVPAHPAAQLIRRPNPWQSAGVLWRGFAFSYIADGNAYFLKLRNAAGRVVQVWYEPHFTIRPRWDVQGREFISYYEVLRNGQWLRVPVDDVIHIPYGVDPYNTRLGLSPVASVMRELLTDSERARYSALLLRNGGIVPVVLSSKDASTSLDAESIRAEFENKTTGDNMGRPIVLDGPIEVQVVGASPDKMLVEKASRIPEERLAAVIGIPAGVLGYGVGLEQTKVGATMRELREQAYEEFIIPTQRTLAEALTQHLLWEFTDDESLNFEHDLSGVRVLQEDKTASYKREALAYECGLKTRAEARKALGMQAKPEDDVYFVEPGQGGAPDAGRPDAVRGMLPSAKAAAIATAQDAAAFWRSSAPEEAQGIEDAEIVD